MSRLKPGIHDIPPAVYHADPCPSPSLSKSVAHILLTQSPLHAWFAHPKLNPKPEPVEAEHFDIGTIAHAMLLEGNDVAVPLDFEDWRTKAAKEARESIREQGQVPILKRHYQRVLDMLESCRRQLERHRTASDMFTGGKPEQTLIWEEDGVWLRSRLDWLKDSRAFIDDYKTTSASANPETVSRIMFDKGADLQAAFYRRGLKHLTGKDAEFRFCYQETYPPYCLSVVQVDPPSMAMAERKVEYAIDEWRKCLKKQSWPGYPNETCWAITPPWHEARWIEFEERTA